MSTVEKLSPRNKRFKRGCAGLAGARFPAPIAGQLRPYKGKREGMSLSESTRDCRWTERTSQRWGRTWGGGICPRNHRVFLAQMTKKFVYLQSSSHVLLEILPGSPLLHPNLAPSDPEPSTQVSTFPVSFLSHLSLPDSALPAAPIPSPEPPAFSPAPSPALLYFLCLLRNPTDP